MGRRIISEGGGRFGAARFAMNTSALTKCLVTAGLIIIAALLLLLAVSCDHAADDAIPAETPAQTAEPTPAPTPTPVPTPTPTPEPTPVPYGLVGEAERVDDEWFDDAAFLGNSLVEGFRMFSGLTNCDFYCATSLAVTGAGPLIDDMAQHEYGKIYILLGINEIGYEPDYFKELYGDMLDTIAENHPDADIYIMAVTPVTEKKSNSGGYFTMERVTAYNEKLLELAEEKGCWFVDLVEALAGEDGYLPEDVTTDGVHFAASHYSVWLEYLRTHHA